MQKWKPLTNICKNHYIWTGENPGSVLVDPNCILLLGVQLLHMFVLLLWAPSDHLLLALATPLWPHEQLVLLCCAQRSKVGYAETKTTSIRRNCHLTSQLEGSVGLSRQFFFFLFVCLLAVWFIESCRGRPLHFPLDPVHCSFSSKIDTWFSSQGKHFVTVCGDGC